MATLTAQKAPGFYSTTGLALTGNAGAPGGDVVAGVNDMLVIAHNSHASNSYTFTITSSADPITGRTGNVSAVTLTPGQKKVFRLTMPGWADSNRQFNFTVENAAILIDCIIL